MEAISGEKPLVKYWIHSGFLTVKGQKMAKSLGNFVTIRDFLKENPAHLLRLLIIKTHYRSPIDYNERLLSQTKKELEKIDEFLDKLNNQKLKAEKKEFSLTIQAKDKNESKSLISRTKKEFERAMQDDFNTPEAIAAIFNLVNEGNYLIAQNKVRPKDASLFLELLNKIDKVFNFIFWKKPKEKIPRTLLDLVKQREECRKNGLWQKADEIRKKIKELGYRIEDTKDGSKIKKI